MHETDSNAAAAAEFRYRYAERCGILLGDRPLTLSAHYLAHQEATEAVRLLYGEAAAEWAGQNFSENNSCNTDAVGVKSVSGKWGVHPTI